MFTRHVITQLKPDSAAAFARIFEDEVVPPLRGQPRPPRADPSPGE